MYIILSKDFREFIAGIFALESDANEFRQRIPEKDVPTLRLEEIQLSYPFYISESHEGFSYHTEEGAKALMTDFAQEMQKNDEEWCYTNLYRVIEDFIPKIPGKDYMGLLPHHHIDNDILEKIERVGFNALWDQ